MKDDTVVALRQPESFSDDPLTEILRAGARQLLGQAIEAEVAAHIEAHADLTDASGRRRIVRHGHMPEREVQTGIGAVTVKRPRVRDRDPQATGGRIRFTSSILPPYLRRAKSVEALLPWLYLKGISSGDFSEALAALLGPDAPGLTASTIGRLKAVWWDEYEAWQKRDLSARRYVYFWADGVYFSPRMDHDKQCVLVIIGADAMGNKDIVGMVDGYRESAQSWKELLLDLKRRGLETGPELAVGDGALGFWKALREVYGETRVQRCWVHKTANVLNQMPKSLQAKAKGHLHDIWMAETRADAEAAFDFFIAAYGAKYHKTRVQLLRLPGRALEAHPHHQPHRKHLRHGAPEDREDQGVPEPQDGARHGLQTDLECQAEMAEAGRIKSTRRTRRRSAVQGRNQDNQTRRLIAPSPTFGHSSRCSIRTLCCSTLFTATKRIVGRVTASQIASASAASFLFRFT